MANMMIRNVDDGVKHAIRRRAAERGVSMEQEVRDILAQGVINKRPKHRKPAFEDVMKLSRRPAKPVDGRAAQEELSAYLYDDDRR